MRDSALLIADLKVADFSKINYAIVFDLSLLTPDQTPRPAKDKIILGRIKNDITYSISLLLIAFGVTSAIIITYENARCRRAGALAFGDVKLWSGEPRSQDVGRRCRRYLPERGIDHAPDSRSAV